MKKTVILLVILAMMTIGASCGGSGAEDDGVLKSETEAYLNLEEDMQGFWMDEDSGIVYGFKGDEYILQTVGPCVAGRFSVDKDTVTMTPKPEYQELGIGDKVYTAKVDDDVLYLSINGVTSEFVSISEEDVRRMYLGE